MYHALVHATRITLDKETVNRKYSSIRQRVSWTLKVFYNIGSTNYNLLQKYQFHWNPDSIFLPVII